MPKIVVTETRLYPIIIHRDGDVWGYHSPEFGGGASVMPTTKSGAAGSIPNATARVR